MDSAMPQVGRAHSRDGFGVEFVDEDQSAVRPRDLLVDQAFVGGLKWNEEDKLKADMMNCPERWEPVTVEQIRAKCRELKMRPNDVETIAGFLARRKRGRRFNVRSSYRDFRFA